MESVRFFTSTLRNHPRGESIVRILAAAIRAVEPSETVRRFARREGPKLIVADQVYDLENTHQIRILGVGKAAQAMTRPLVDLLTDRTPFGLLIPKQAFSSSWTDIEVQPGGHPIPDENSLKAGQKALDLVSGMDRNDLLICLISGGGSALMTAPHPSLSLSDLQALTRSLLECGAPIDEVNTLRRHLDQIKGGGLARAASPARLVSLILSDVVGNPLEAIASGPTAPDPTTSSDALNILHKYKLTQEYSSTVVRFLESAPETPKPEDPLFAGVQNVLIGSNIQAAQAGLEQARALGFHPRFLGDTWQGEARETAKELCSLLKQEGQRPFCMIAGGETTVTLRGKGLGGRNQELALAAARELAGLKDVMLITLATDGEDGPTNAAGAVVTGESLRLASGLGLDPDAYLYENDSYHFFETLGDLLVTKPTGTNVNDLTFLFGF